MGAYFWLKVIAIFTFEVIIAKFTATILLPRNDHDLYNPSYTRFYQQVRLVSKLSQKRKNWSKAKCCDDYHNLCALYDLT